MKTQTIKGITILALLMILMSSATQLSATNIATPINQINNDSTQTLAIRKLTFVQKVSDNQVYTKNITGDLSFNIVSGDKDISAPGALYMRKDEVIRIQLFIPILGSEVGRLEFTPDYVLIIDRIHKEYIKENYNQLAFLRDNGLNFYSLQALFWNQLTLPGVQKVQETDLKRFDVDLNASDATMPLSINNGNMKYVWHANKTSGLISGTDVTYAGGANGTSTLNWEYSNFMRVGAKVFPGKQVFTFTTTATKQKQSVKVTLDMDKIGTDANWNVQSTVSDKYKKVNAQDVFSQILSM